MVFGSQIPSFIARSKNAPTLYPNRFRPRAFDLACVAAADREIQIRSTMEHAWATAVETIDAFTGQALKTNILGDATWKRFFSLMSSGIAILEKQPLVPLTPHDIKDLCSELRDVCKRLNVPNVFYGLSAGMALTKTIKSPARIYILTLDSEARNTRVVGSSALYMRLAGACPDICKSNGSFCIHRPLALVCSREV